MERKQCEFQLIRYVPDPVRNEFVNIGVLLRTSQGEQSELRFTRDWSRVRCLDPDADIPMLEGLESEIAQRLRVQPADLTKPIMTLLEDTLSNGIQMTETKAHLAETFVSAIEDLMRRYVDTPPRERSQRLGGRAALRVAIRTQFEKAGVWGLMQKNIAAAQYTRPGDPLRIECGYRNGLLKMFQPVSLEINADDARLLAFSAPRLANGVKRLEHRDLLLTAIVEPIRWPAGNNEPDEERRDLYEYANAIMKEQGIRVMASSELPNLAQAARDELHV